MVKPLDLRYACAAVFGSVAAADWRNNTLDSFLADHKSMVSSGACEHAAARDHTLVIGKKTIESIVTPMGHSD